MQPTITIMNFPQLSTIWLVRRKPALLSQNGLPLLVIPVEKNSEYAIAKTSVTLGEVAVNALSPRTQQGGLTHAVNIIAKTRNNYYL